MTSDLQKKDELRRELRLLVRILRAVENSDTALASELLSERIEDIQKALED